MADPKPFICDNCGDVADCVFLIDGYHIGDTLLEGVTFRVQNVSGKPKCHGVVDEDKDYFDNLNARKRIGICEDFCKERDVLECPKCGEEVAGWYWLNPKKQDKIERIMESLMEEDRGRSK